MIKRLINFIKHGIWQKDETEIVDRKDRWFILPFKIIIYTFKGFGEHQIMLRAAALTFYTLMSIVPIAALIFAVVRGFGIDTNFMENLYMRFPEYSVIIDKVAVFADKMLLRTSSGIIAAVGFVVLAWAVMRVFGNMEASFNNIWEIKKQRSFARKFSDYMVVVIVAPILWVASNGISLYIRNTLSYFTTSWILEVVYALGSLVILWIMFAFVYFVMPNTKVKIKSAIIAGIIAGTFFQIFQVGYFFVQSNVSNYNAIYGSFAALPLFLIWMQASWAILLFGAEISFAYQNIKRYEQEREALHMSVDHKRKVMLATMLIIAKHFVKHEGAVSSEDISTELDMPVRIIREVIFELENAGFVASVTASSNDKQNKYVPAQDIHKITVFDVINRVEKTGTSQIDVDESIAMEKVFNIIEGFKQRAYESPLNVYLTDLI